MTSLAGFEPRPVEMPAETTRRLPEPCELEQASIGVGPVGRWPVWASVTEPMLVAVAAARPLDRAA
jgi:hypothetical protein